MLRACCGWRCSERGRSEPIDLSGDGLMTRSSINPPAPIQPSTSPIAEPAATKSHPRNPRGRLVPSEERSTLSRTPVLASSALHAAVRCPSSDAPRQSVILTLCASALLRSSCARAANASGWIIHSRSSRSNSGAAPTTTSAFRASPSPSITPRFESAMGTPISRRRPDPTSLSMAPRQMASDWRAATKFTSAPGRCA